ncbi:MAG TPA: hypothetical protein PLI09_04465 [Candidatus Hydrogenedentes bacterium]|nr:hypothetical protein [Candidatus Hydrogenedentota bacterium]
MNTHIKISVFLCLSALLLAGCPELQPRFDTTGDYSGDFTVGFKNMKLVDGCGIEISLEQNVDALPLLNAQVNGTVTLSFDCILPEDLAGLLSEKSDVVAAALAALGGSDLATGLPGLLTIPPITLTGALLPDGTIELNTPNILDDCTEGECEKLGIVGKGEDVNDDGAMDTFSGTLAGTISTSLGILPIVGNFEVASQ